MANKIKIKSDTMNFIGSKILINGQEIPVTDFELHGNVKDGIWQVTLTLLPKDGLEIDIEDVNLTVING